MIRVTGAAIHSGVTSRVTLHRDSGPLRFRRAGTTIEARLANVVGAQRATSLGADGEQVHLVEHLLAALRIHGFYSGVLVEAEAAELPILDGSALPWSEALAQLGAPPPAPAPLQLTRPVEVRVGDATARAMQGSERLEYAISFEHPAIGAQAWHGHASDYPDLIAARTFGFMEEWEALKAQNLALGASEEHVIVFAMEGPTRPLRFPQEPVMHKALDALGDLALLGAPLAAHVSVSRGSHALHHALARAVAAAAQ